MGPVHVPTLLYVKMSNPLWEVQAFLYGLFAWKPLAQSRSRLEEFAAEVFPSLRQEREPFLPKDNMEASMVRTQEISRRTRNTGWLLVAAHVAKQLVFPPPAHRVTQLVCPSCPFR